MASTVKEKVTVQELSKYGFKANGEYINWSKNVKESDKGRVVPGGTFEMELYIADSGKKYVNSVSASTDQIHGDVPNVPKPLIVKTVSKAAAKTDAMSKDEWQAKDTRISRQGVIQVAVQVAGSFEDAVKLANQMLDFVNQKV